MLEAEGAGMETERLLTTNEAAGLLRCTRRALYNHMRAGRLRAYRPGGRWLIPQSAIDEFLTAKNK